MRRAADRGDGEIELAVLRQRDQLLSELAFTDGWTTSRCGEYASIVTPRRSFFGSNGSFEYTEGVIASAPTSQRSSV